MLNLGSNCVSKCPKGTINNEGICTSTSYQILISYTSAVESYLVQFPAALVEDIANVSLITTVTLEGVDPEIYSYKLTKINQLVYQIDFQWTQSIPSTTLKLRYLLNDDPPTTNPLIGRWIAAITSKYMAYISDSDKDLVASISKAAKTTMQATAIGAGSIAILGGNPALLWPLLNLFQAFYYLIFIDVNYPANAKIFLEIFSLGSLDFIPNPLDWFVHDIDQYDLPVPGRYIEYDFTGLFLENAGNELLFLGLVIVAYILAKLLMKWIRMMPISLRTLSNRTVGWFEWSGILNSLMSSYTDTVQAIFLQMRVLAYSSKVFALSSILAIVTLGSLALLPIVLLGIIKKYGRKKKFLNDKFDALVGQYNVKKEAGRYYVPIWLLKRLVMCVSLVFLQGYPFMQISLLCVLVVCSVIHVWGFTPYSSIKDNICNTIIEVLYGLIHVVIYVLIYDDNSGSFSEEKRFKFGWAIVTFCVLILVISVILTVIEQIREIWCGLKLIKLVLLKASGKKKGFKKKRIETENHMETENGIITIPRQLAGSPERSSLFEINTNINTSQFNFTMDSVESAGMRDNQRQYERSVHQIRKMRRAKVAPEPLKKRVRRSDLQLGVF